MPARYFRQEQITGLRSYSCDGQTRLYQNTELGLFYSAQVGRDGTTYNDCQTKWSPVVVIELRNQRALDFESSFDY